MSKRAVFKVTVAGTNITATLMPVLISLTVSDKVGTHSDTASLEIDDTDGRIILPQIGAPVIVALGCKMRAREADVRIDIAGISLNGGFVGTLRSADITLLQRERTNGNLHVHQTGIFR